MKKFMDEDFLLSTEVAKKLYHGYAKKMPIIDYHCHISPKEIAEDIRFKNITQLWLAGDHYKWRQMRSNGVEEKYITGEASDREKFQKWAETLEMAIGNPLYHWSHLELQRYFGYEGVLNGETAEEVWQLTKKVLVRPEMSARGIITSSKVELLCTTDDPIDDLHWHEILAFDTTFKTKVLPTWRPDRAIAVEKEDFVAYLEQLSESAGIKIEGFGEWKQAILKRMKYFEQKGCRASDHGLLYIPYVEADELELERIFKKRLCGEKLTEREEQAFKTAALQFLGEQYAHLGWVMQLHFGVTRNNNTRMFQLLGADTGFDGIYNRVPVTELAGYLDSLCKKKVLPKTILYSLNPTDNAVIATLIGCFQEAGAKGKLQQGSAWWFNDHKPGMLEQMTSLASLGLLGNFIGMLTDSRSLLSYTRHEYFRRLLCELIGAWVENGEYLWNEKHLGALIEAISYGNVKHYFEF